MSDIAKQRLRDREQLIQEITQAPDDLVQAMLEFLHQTKAVHTKHSTQEPTLASFVGALQNSLSFQGDPLIIQQQIRHEWEQ